MLERPLIGELARSIGNLSNTVRLLRYNSLICYVSNVNVLLKAYRCPSFDQFINKGAQLERLPETFEEELKHIHPKDVCQLGQTLFDKLDVSGIPYSDDHRIFKNTAKFDFESIRVQ